jgi:predicted porin
MKRTYIATLIASMSMVTINSHAIEIYKDDKNSVTVGGFIDARVISTQGETEIVNGVSRINLDFKRQLKNKWQALAFLEWGVNPVGNSDIVYNNRFETVQDEFLYNRLGYVGVKHEKYGRITVGKQWGAWYDVVYNTNYSLVWDGNAAGVYTYNKDDGAVNGTGRGDKVLQYRNNWGNFHIALQTQLKSDDFYTCDIADISRASCQALWDQGNNAAQKVEFNSTYGAALSYYVTDELKFTAGVNRGQFEILYAGGRKQSVTDLIYGVGMTYGDFNKPGWYASANINKNENHDTDNLGRLIKEAVGSESLVSYRFDNDIRTFLAYNIFDAGDDYVIQPNFNADPNDVFKRQFAVLGLHYFLGDDTILYIEARKDFSDFSSNDAEQEAQMSQTEDDGIAIGFNYTL